jgi:hypothetical protein
MDGYIVDPKAGSPDDLEHTAWGCKVIETTVLSALKPLPANYLDDEAVEIDKAGTKQPSLDDGNESPPTKKKRKLSFKNTQMNGVEETV